MSGVHRAERSLGDLPQATSQVEVPTAEAMREFGHSLAAVLRAGDLLVLAGDLGAGKTTLTQGIGKGLRVRGEVTSPTFVIARVHPTLVGGPSLVHVDAYRLASLAEVDDLDLDATLAESVTVVEWGEGMVEELAADRLEIRLTRPHGSLGGPDARPTDGDELRRVELVGFGLRWQGVRLPAEQGAALPPS